jgi:cob(I)alamin adenosyltransferase
MKIYTKTGDKGGTRLVDGRECSKSDLRVETYGSVDELSSTLGVAIAVLRQHSEWGRGGEQLVDELLIIQNQLFTLGSHLACENEERRKTLPPLPETWIQALEQQIDHHTGTLPALKNFILPGGSLDAAHLHVARTVCRRAERMVVRLIEEKTSESSERALRYLNRLSDYLFTVARRANQLAKIPDQEWRK